MKKIIPLLLAAAFCPALAGCSSASAGGFFPVARDITNVEVMRTMALDQGEEEGNVSVTVSGGVRPGDQGSEPQPPVILTREAPTVFSACLTIQTYGDGYVSFGHIGQCVLSAEAAEQGIVSLLDFSERNFEMRMDTNVFLVAEGRAEDLVTQVASESRAATDRLESIARDLPLESYGWPVSVRELLIDIEDNGCALLPVVELKQEGEETSISCDRMCWFQEERYADVLDSDQSRAAAIVMNEAQSGVIEETLSDGSKVGLRLTDTKIQWKLNWEGKTLVGAEAQVQVKADLAELQGGADIYQLAVQEEMDQRLSEELKGQIQEVLELAQKEKADFFHLGRHFQTLSPRRSRVLRENWEKWFPELELQVKVNGVVERSYDINRAEGKR